MKNLYAKKRSPIFSESASDKVNAIDILTSDS